MACVIHSNTRQDRTVSRLCSAAKALLGSVPAEAFSAQTTVSLKFSSMRPTV